MRRMFFLLLCGVLAGCQNSKNSIETGASTILLADAPVIEKVDLNIKYRTEW